MKAEAWERINGDGYGSLYLTNAAMSGFNWVHQRDLLNPYVGKFFEALPGIFRSRDREFASDYLRTLFPGHRIDQATLEQSENAERAFGEELPVLGRMLRESNDDLARAIRCRAFAANSAK